MNRINQLFQDKGKDILNIYFTAGYPALDDTAAVAVALEKAGADLLEIGMPYSDPLADGPTIQESSMQALKNGMSLDLLFEQIQAIRLESNIPLIVMGYFNQVMQYGDKAFLAKCKEMGVDGLILPDLPLHEYELFYKELFEEYGLGISFLITPQTSNERIRKIDQLSKGFVYMVANSSITGAKSGISDQQLAYFERIAQMELQTPRLIGFGISSHGTFRTACDHSNGAIIGSAFIRHLSAHGATPDSIETFIHSILSPAAKPQTA